MKKGFTLVELLVVIAILGMLMSIILPAVNQARAMARLLECKNKIRQLGLGCQTYLTKRGQFPTSMGYHPEGPAPRGNLSGRGWICLILPQLEQESLHRQLSVGFEGSYGSGTGMNHPDIREAMGTVLTALCCPDDPEVRSLNSSQFQLGGIPVAQTSYKGVLGDNKMGDGSMHPGWQNCHDTTGCRGIFYRNSYQEPVKPATVKDGMSYTFLVGEDVCEHNTGHTAAYFTNGDYCSASPPLNFKPDPKRPGDWWDVMGFRSNHTGGANFAMADASVTFISDEIELSVYWALSTKAGGEIINAEDL